MSSALNCTRNYRITSEKIGLIFSLNFTKNMNLHTSASRGPATGTDPQLSLLIAAIERATPEQLKIDYDARVVSSAGASIASVCKISLNSPGMDAEFKIIGAFSAFPLTGRLEGAPPSVVFSELSCSDLRVNQGNSTALNSSDTELLDAAVFKKIDEFRHAAQQKAVNMLAEVAGSPLDGPGYDLFVNSWRVKGAELAPHPHFQANFDGVELSLFAPKRSALVWFPNIVLEASCTVGGVTAVATEAGKALRPLYNEIRRRNNETASSFGERYAVKKS